MVAQSVAAVKRSTTREQLWVTPRAVDPGMSGGSRSAGANSVLRSTTCWKLVTNAIALADHREVVLARLMITLPRFGQISISCRRRSTTTLRPRRPPRPGYQVAAPTRSSTAPWKRPRKVIVDVCERHDADLGAVIRRRSPYLLRCSTMRRGRERRRREHDHHDGDHRRPSLTWRALVQLPRARVRADSRPDRERARS